MNRIILSYFPKFLERFYHSSVVRMSTEKICNDAKQIFHVAVKSVQPGNLINRTIELSSNFIEIQGERFDMTRHIYLVGFGKAVLGMAIELENKLKGNIKSGIVSIPDGFLKSSTINKNHYHNSCIQVYEGAVNNIPDEKSHFAATKISELVASLKETDLLFVLISGGGSALLPSPKPPVTLPEKSKVIKLLNSKGASIEEINVVRKRLSTLKGGGLAELARPAKVVSLILSDIVGDPLGLIASGPTVQNTDDPQLPLTIIEKYNLKKEIPTSVLKLLQNLQIKNASENESGFSHVSNFIIGNNQLALDAAALVSQDLNYIPCLLTNVLIGKASHIGFKLISLVTAALEHQDKLVHQIYRELRLAEESLNNLRECIQMLELENKKFCILLGGETTVEVHGTGVGGRNQELALAAAIELKTKKTNRSITLLSGGTDGIDGPNDAAGAIATAFTVELGELENLCASQCLDNNDSYTFYSKLSNGQFHVKTGHTGTNVMDIIIILIE